jgi:hypothetical protein
VHLAVLLAAEEARFAQVGDLPLISVIEDPQGSAVRINARAAGRGAMAALLGLSVAVLVLFGRLLVGLAANRGLGTQPRAGSADG